MTEQVIYSRYEYPIDRATYMDVVDEYNAMFDQVFNEHGVHIGGVTPALAVDTQRVILLVYSREVDAFLKLKFAHRKDVQVNRYITEEKS